jgi:hypothetical protein
MHVLSSCLFETLEAFGRLVNRPDRFLADDLLRRCGTPGAPPPLTASLSQPTGVQTALGVFERADGLFMRPGEIAHGCSFDWGDIDGGEIT